MSLDIPHEAEVLVKRMTSDPNVKINEHWKVCYLCGLLESYLRIKTEFLIAKLS